MPDVLVVGAGLIGCGIAYELAKRGAEVTVCDLSLIHISEPTRP